jgi:hypothetical protein
VVKFSTRVAPWSDTCIFITLLNRTSAPCAARHLYIDFGGMIILCHNMAVIVWLKCLARVTNVPYVAVDLPKASIWINTWLLIKLTWNTCSDLLAFQILWTNN